MRNHRHIWNARRWTRDRLFPTPCTRTEKYTCLRKLPSGRYARKQNQEWSQRSLSLCPRWQNGNGQGEHEGRINRRIFRAFRQEPTSGIHQENVSQRSEERRVGKECRSRWST